MNDSERSPYGLGWEYKRRGQSIDHNPFDKELEPRRWQWFREGFIDYIPNSLQLVKSQCQSE